MKLFIFRVLIYFVFILFECTLFAQNEGEIPNRFTLTNGYFEDTFNSNEGMAYFPMSIYEAYDWGFRKLSADKYGVGRFFSWFLSGIFQTYYFNSTYLNVPFHEFGHATRFRSFGGINVKYYVDDNHTEIADSYFEMVYARAQYPSQGAATTALISTQTSTQDRLIISAGGMNNEILLSKLLAERVYDRGGSVPDFFYYYLNKISPYEYSSQNPSEDQVGTGDPEKIENYYTTLGKNITRNDLKDAYMFSLFASGSFYSLLWGDLKYIGTGDHNVKIVDIYGISLPDFYAYINTKGLSMETMMHYRVNKALSFGLSYEKVYLGENYDQISPQLRYTMKVNSSLIKYLILKPQFVMGLGENGVDLGGSFLTEVEGSSLGLFLKYTYYNKENLYGERNIPFVDKPNELLGGFFVNLQ